MTDSDPLPCQNCGTPDADCLSVARQTGTCCCRSCREWQMHSPAQIAPSFVLARLTPSDQPHARPSDEGEA
ncbi:hypothetical protein JCM18899A_18610 [Nocardioides sp. AN3]